MVPVVRDADAMSLAEIEKAIGALGKKARDGQLALEDLQGGTFTISNGGVYGSLMSTPILNAPQSGILGMHKIQDRPMAVGGQVVIRPMMYLALSLRPPRGRRPGRGDLPGPRQGSHRGAAAPAARPLRRRLGMARSGHRGMRRPDGGGTSPLRRAALGRTSAA